mmetsp:Transcript_3683/g.3643  ORF Transcript_3683/g.3643 Transcript_3683/m.3643 type:complete len:129 (+) Transcript_3683:46-432(+)
MAECVSCKDLNENDLLSNEEIQIFLENSHFWKRNSQNFLSRSFIAKNFQSALNFINRVGLLAENNGHHPDIHITSYRNVEIVLFTHSVNGITQIDINMARLIDEIPVEYSPKWYRENFPEKSHQNKST